MELNQAQNYFNSVATKVQEAQIKAALRAATNGLALIKNRILTKGELGSGQKMEKYSENQMSLNKFDSRSGGDAKKKNLIKKGKYTASYKEWRQINGLTITHRNLKFTGAMLNNIKPILTSSSIGLIKIAINATNQDEEKKVIANTFRSGNFLTPSRSEMTVITDTYNNEFAKELINILK